MGKAPGETSALAETSAAQTQAGQSTSGNVVTAGNSKVSDRPVVLPAADGAAAEADIKQPEVAAEGAVLLNAATGEVLYGKNQDQQFYPASITKVMTALVVLEHCNLNDTVTFSKTATTNLESGRGGTLGVSEGDQLTVEQSLYGLLLKSANEIGNGLAEHVIGQRQRVCGSDEHKSKGAWLQKYAFCEPAWPE